MQSPPGSRRSVQGLPLKAPPMVQTTIQSAQVVEIELLGVQVLGQAGAGYVLAPSKLAAPNPPLVFAGTLRPQPLPPPRRARTLTPLRGARLGAAGTPGTYTSSVLRP